MTSPRVLEQRDVVPALETWPTTGRGPTQLVTPRDALDEAMSSVAQACGAWVLVERQGVVLGHAPGVDACPGPATEALLTRRIQPLEEGIHWGTGADSHGVLAGLSVRVEHLDADTRAWALGGRGVPPLAALREVVPEPDLLIHDAVVAKLLRPSPAGTPVPRVRLVVLAGPEPARLARRILGRLTNPDSRVHHHKGRVVVALSLADSVAPLRRALPCSAVTAIGVSVVPEGASDWCGAFRVAAAACDLARRRDVALLDADKPTVMAELVLEVAAEAGRAFADDVHFPPLARLRDYDARTGSSLLMSLAAWCSCDGNMGEAARALHVHINTLRYRLRRAGEIAGLDATNLPQRLALQRLMFGADPCSPVTRLR